MSPPICDPGRVEGVTGDAVTVQRLSELVYQEQINTRDTRSAMI